MSAVTKNMRAFTAAPNDGRCKQDIRLRDGSGAQCMRAARKDGLCLQHWRMIHEPDDRGFGSDGPYSGEHGNL